MSNVKYVNPKTGEEVSKAAYLNANEMMNIEAVAIEKQREERSRKRARAIERISAALNLTKEEATLIFG